MEKVSNRISLFFVLILFVLIWGFYKTYIVFFPTFKGFNSVQHFHGALMLIWLSFLIAQPLLIRAGKNHIHRIIGKVSYIIAPLLLISIFLASRMVYYRSSEALPQQEAIGLIALSIPGLVAFAIMYLLAIINKKETDKHMRYMIGTSLLLIGPGLGRALIVNFNYSLQDAVNYTDYLVILIAMGMLVYDLIKKKNYIPNTIILVILLLTHAAWHFRYSDTWQTIGEGFARVFF